MSKETYSSEEEVLPGQLDAQVLCRGEAACCYCCSAAPLFGAACTCQSCRSSLGNFSGANPTLSVFLKNDLFYFIFFLVDVNFAVNMQNQIERGAL